MVLINVLIRFYQKIHNYKIPKLKFKELDNRYKEIYKKEFNVYENDINKANFIIFLIFFNILLISLIYLTKFSLILIILLSLYKYGKYK